MGHTQLTQDERYPIQYLSRHRTVTEIAKQPNRHKSTISRESRRHRTQGRQYSAEQAQRQSRLTKRGCTRLADMLPSEYEDNTLQIK